MNWQQLQTILWLRWRLSWNQINRGNKLNLIFGAIAIFGSYLLAIGATVAGFFTGWKLLGPGPDTALLITWDGLALAFLFAWTIGLLTELQRSEAIDLQRLLHLPISLPQLFTLNYISSHVTFSVILAAPGMLALSMGMMVYLGPRMILLFPLVIGFILMVSAWSYFLRGWLLSLMVNQRKKRAILVTATISLVLLVQLPNFYFNVYHRANRRPTNRSFPVTAYDLTESPQARLAHTVSPPLWLGNSVYRLRQGDWMPAFAGCVGLWGLAGLGLWMAYRSTLRFYQGGPSNRSAKVGSSAVSAKPVAAPASRGPRKPLMVEWEIPGLRDDAAGFALASVRSMLRAPELRMAMLGPIVMLLMFGSLMMSRSRPTIPLEAQAIIPTALISLLFFALLQLLLNQFGFDRNGFRALVLMPTPRKYLLLGKNLALAPFITTPALLALAVIGVLMHISPIAIAASFFQIITLYLLCCTIGNLFSILAPFRINPGSLKPTKHTGSVALLGLLSHLCFPILCIPVFAPPVAEMLLHNLGVGLGIPINLLLSPLFTGIALGVYILTLGPLGAWMETREQRVLLVLTQEVE